MQPTIKAERSHLSCGTEPRAPLNDVAQRGHMRRAEAEAKAMAIGKHCGRVAAQYRLAAPKEESRCLECGVVAPRGG